MVPAGSVTEGGEMDDVGAKDFKFGVTGLGLCVLIALIFLIAS